MSGSLLIICLFILKFFISVYENEGFLNPIFQKKRCKWMQNTPHFECFYYKATINLVKDLISVIF